MKTVDKKNKPKVRRHNKNWQDHTGTERQRNRRFKLNKMAASFGFKTWSEYETAMLNKTTRLRFERLRIKNKPTIKHVHSMITLKALRDVYARELLASRPARKLGEQYYAALRFGMESAFWALEREAR